MSRAIPGSTDLDLVYRRPPVLPRPSALPAPFSIPVFATTAPVIGSVVMWAITQSVFALLFAALGPLIAVASLGDSAIQSRRLSRREGQRVATEVTAALQAIDEWHDIERAAREALHPAIPAILSGDPASVDTWRASEIETDAATPAAMRYTVRVGRGDSRSTLTVDGGTENALDPRERELIDSVRIAATRLSGAPILVDSRLGIGFCGPPAVARAAARALVCQLARSLSPEDTIIRSSTSSEWDWLDELPHRRGLPIIGAGRGEDSRVELSHVPDAGARQVHSTIVIGVAVQPEGLPRRCGIVISVGAGGPATLGDRGGRDIPSGLDPDFAAFEEARVLARTLRQSAIAEGFLGAGSGMPDRVAYASLPNAPVNAPMSSAGSAPVGSAGNETDRDAGGANDGRPTGRDAEPSLKCAVGHTSTGLWEVDLVADGPHAAVGGTTGSGKSELLITWLLAIAARYPPSEVNFLLVDFKGGASFAALTALPHSVGLITDLDETTAKRALESLRAELLYRERALAAAGVRAIDDVPRSVRLARLLIVVDEFAALAGGFPELHELFADLASRGRSLGIHLILCTQRPAVALRDSILANCTLRISLRLNSRADSLALIGSAAASSLPHRPVGRALVGIAGATAQEVQIAIAEVSDPQRVRERWASHSRGRRPWCDPLPNVLPIDTLERSAVGMAFGRRDLPAEQRQSTAIYDPSRHGNLLILGARGSGKSTTLLTLAAGAHSIAVVRVPTEVEGAWDVVADVAAALSGPVTGAPHPQRVFLIDDIDSLVAGFGSDHQLEFIDLLTRLLRDGPSRGTSVAMACQRLPGLLQGVGALCESRLVLRLPTRHDHLLAGERGDDFDERMPPGRGFWRGTVVQVAHAPAQSSPPPAVAPRLGFDPAGATVVVTRSPRAIAAALGERPEVRVIDIAEAAPSRGGLEVHRASRHTVVVGDPEAWQAAWSFLATIKGSIPMVFHGCTVAEFRAIAQSRRLPPPLSPATSHAWLVTADDAVTRTCLDADTSPDVRPSNSRVDTT